MTRPWREMARRVAPELVFLAVVALAQSLALAWALQDGPVTISDDDYARVVISQRFALAPSVDPTGTSWLPLPFFVQGASLALGDGSLGLARAVELGVALVSSFGLYFSGRILGAPRLIACLGALLALSIPYAARLAVATVPEYPTAVLACLAIAGASAHRARPDHGRALLFRLVAGVAAALGTACRYETWAIACGVFACSALDAFRARKHPDRRMPLVYLGGALLSVSFILAWLLHGVVRHDSATFFVTRVANYRAALGEAGPSTLGLVLEGYPRALLLLEPSALLLPLSLGALLLVSGRRLSAGEASRGTPGEAGFSLLRVLGLGALLLLLLVVGEVRGGAPTHHPERALLSVWLFGCVLTGALVGRLVVRGLPLKARIFGALVVGAAYLASALLREAPAPFTDRTREEAIGRLIPAGEQVVLATRDYGYFAVMAAAGNPARFHLVADHDPRSKNKESGPLGERATRLAEKHGARLIVAPLDEPPPGAELRSAAAPLGLFALGASGRHPP